MDACWQMNAHIHIEKYLFHFYILFTEARTHPDTRTHRASASSNHQSCLFEGSRQRGRDGVKGGLPNKVKNIRDNNNSSTHWSITLFSLPACLPLLGFVSSHFVSVSVSMCVARCREESRQARHYPGHCLFLWCGHADLGLKEEVSFVSSKGKT